MPHRIPISLERFDGEEMTWCRARVTALRIMLPALDPVLRSLIQAMTVEGRSDPSFPDRIELPLENLSATDLALASDLIGRLATSAESEKQSQPAKLLSAICGALARESAQRE